jgi:predicted nucleic acid-binding Zn ribbon protein
VSKRKGTPEPLGAALAGFLARAGLTKRIEQASIVDEWAALVGQQIASVTAARMITRDGTLFVDVTTNAWMQELSLMEPQLLKALRERPSGVNVQRIRWRLGRT